MNPKHFGDTYDIVKQSLLRYLAPLGPWYAHPMFTGAFDVAQGKAFEALLGVSLVSTEVLTPRTDRGSYFSTARACPGHLFLDPDIGVWIKSTRGKKAPAHLFAAELVEVARRSPRLLTMVFDQALPRGGEATSLGLKLEWLASAGLHGFAYQSHVSFILVGCCASVVGQARGILESHGHLPQRRFVEGGNRTTPQSSGPLA